MYIATNDKRNPKIIKENLTVFYIINPNGNGQVEYTKYTSTKKVSRTINVTADEVDRVEKAIASGNGDNIDDMFYDTGIYEDDEEI